jgi:hypothetical protein
MIIDGLGAALDNRYSSGVGYRKEELPCLVNFIGEFYQDYHIVGVALGANGTVRWTSKVTIYPPVKVSLSPTVLTGVEGLFATETEAEQEAVRMGREWVDRQPP